MIRSSVVFSSLIFFLRSHLITSTRSFHMAIRCTFQEARRRHSGRECEDSGHFHVDEETRKGCNGHMQQRISLRCTKRHQRLGGLEAVFPSILGMSESSPVLLRLGNIEVMYLPHVEWYPERFKFSPSHLASSEEILWPMQENWFTDWISTHR
ncbi:hypothetical protein BDR07DRAFT_1386768 [Suillus spraguei]|nr:hypothetical protein BDR07DRAFT_1386768 [Suillus spraguei]